jgi:ubiquinone/menaquinone biosynthesis C-methylase UbiE
MIGIFVPYSAGQRTKEQIEKVHQDPRAYIAMLENPQRDKEQKPDEVIAALDLKPGETLADIGAGSGYFTFRFARKVGDTGRVYAVDINSDMILYMNRYIRDKKVKNVTTILSAPDDPLLADASINRFFICNTWHHIQNRPQYIARMKTMLKPGGQIIVVDYKKKQLPVGPPPEMKLTKKEVIAELEAGGFKLAKEHDFLPYQYFLVFTSK